ncbi:MAG: alpha-1,4-glucan--maltose-1-phosphate maltosyltransferase [Bacteroidales bacterium]
MKHIKGRERVIIENVYPELDCGKYPIRRVAGEKVKVSADVFADGHNEIRAVLLYRKKGKRKWIEIPMKHISNDRWEADFRADEMGWYEYTITGWIDHFATWQRGFKLKYEANQEIDIELQIGAGMMKEAARLASPKLRKKIDSWVTFITDVEYNPAAAAALVLGEEVSKTMYINAERRDATVYEKTLQAEVERKRALFSSWYEVFPRSTSSVPGRHGTFKDVENVIPLIAKMGFDILYFPPIHPIGISFRKGKDNAPVAKAGEPGSPWAIGSKEGGHKAIHPELGSLEDFRNVIKKAAGYNIEIALDLAYQCSQDHPYVKEHPEWFSWRPDGTVQYAENPPKKYQDVLPMNFENDDWQNMWKELKSIADYWIDQGVNVFRVDNPHTKSFGFWEWMIREIKKKHPQVIFMAEAFTRNKVMDRLGKIGFTQSYTYFTWRNSPQEFVDYLNELTRTERREFYRPNFWPNTPDILPVSLQHKNEAAFIARLVMAATLSSNYGIYGPVFEFMHNIPHPLREEYVDNEKYEINHYDWKTMTRMRKLIALVNSIRKENPALQTTWNIYFAEVQNDQLLCYGKTDDEKENRIFVVVNMDTISTQGSWIKIPLKDMGIPAGQEFLLHDLLTGNRFKWSGEWNYVELNPQVFPVHIFKIEQ